MEESLSGGHEQVDDDLVLAGRSLAWRDGVIVAIDQRQLPGSYVVMRLTTVDEVIEAIATLAIRGAPAIGIAGALGVALSARRHISSGRMDVAAVETDARLAAARPTAVNLAWAVDRQWRTSRRAARRCCQRRWPSSRRTSGQPCRRRTRRRPRARHVRPAAAAGAHPLQHRPARNHRVGTALGRSATCTHRERWSWCSHRDASIVARRV